MAIFFGLSGTGKTTLSADPTRTLIGDDEHGWSDNGIFNFEGGCYAKVIHLSPTAEPEIYETTRRFGTILENVGFDSMTGRLDLNDDSLTENTRAAYPISHIPNATRDGLGGHPQNIIMLTCDAFGVLPPMAKLTPAQAMYHFLSGYTAKVAGTEKGVTEPSATFSTCFGAPFMALPPTVYANLLGEKIASPRRRRLAGEHRLERRPLRRGPADGHRSHPGPGACGSGRLALQGAHDYRAPLRSGRTQPNVPGCRRKSSTPGTPGAIRPRTMPRPRSWRACLPKTSKPLRTR